MRVVLFHSRNGDRRFESPKLYKGLVFLCFINWIFKKCVTALFKAKDDFLWQCGFSPLFCGRSLSRNMDDVIHFFAPRFHLSLSPSIISLSLSQQPQQLKAYIRNCEGFTRNFSEDGVPLSSSQITKIMELKLNYAHSVVNTRLKGST